MKTLIYDNREYEYFYTAEDGEYFIPKKVVHGAEPWMKLTEDGVLYSLFNGRWSKEKKEYEVK